MTISAAMGPRAACRRFDSYFEFAFPAAGTYIIAVGQFPSSASGGVVSGAPLDPDDLYTLQISLENHVTGGAVGSTGGPSFYFGSGDNSPVPNNVPAGPGERCGRPTSVSRGTRLKTSPFCTSTITSPTIPMRTGSRSGWKMLNSSGTVAGQTLLASSNSSDYANPDVSQLFQDQLLQLAAGALALAPFAGKENLRCASTTRPSTAEEKALTSTT